MLPIPLSVSRNMASGFQTELLATDRNPNLGFFRTRFTAQISPLLYGPWTSLAAFAKLASLASPVGTRANSKLSHSPCCHSLPSRHAAHGEGYRALADPLFLPCNERCRLAANGGDFAAARSVAP